MDKPPTFLNFRSLPGSKGLNWGSLQGFGFSRPASLRCAHFRHISKVDSGLENASGPSGNGRALGLQKDLALLYGLSHILKNLDLCQTLHTAVEEALWMPELSLGVTPHAVPHCCRLGAFCCCLLTPSRHVQAIEEEIALPKEAGSGWGRTG